MASLALLAPSVRASVATDIQTELAAVIEKTAPAFVRVGGASGAIVSPDGYVLTNHHVVAKRLKQPWTVQVTGHGTFRGKVVGYDASGAGDIALIKLEGAKDLPYLEIAPSDGLQAGQWVFTLGNPYSVAVDHRPSVSLGIVSAVHVASGFYDDGIQTDASINPGNSGGPLIDLRGRLVGIAGKHAVRWIVRTSTGANYAVGSSRVLKMLDRLKTGETVYESRLEGLDFGPDTDRGTVAVEGVAPGSQAEASGFRPGDEIVRFQGDRVTSARNFFVRLAPEPWGSELKFDIRRNGKEQSLTVPLKGLMDPASPEAIFQFLEQVMGGHQHLPHPRTRQSLCLDFSGVQETVKPMGSDRYQATLLYLDKAQELCEVDVVVQVSPQGQHRIIRGGVAAIGDTSFRRSVRQEGEHE